MGRVIGLQNHFSLFPAPPCPSGTLCNEVESLLRRQIGRNIQNAVGRKNAYRLHTGNIMAFSHHLGTEKYIKFPLSEIIQNFPGTVLPSGTVQVKPSDSGLRQEISQFFFYPFRTRPQVEDTGAMTYRAFSGKGVHCFAVMALQPVHFLMVHQRYIAVGTFEHMAAGRAHKGGGKSTPVQKENGFILFKDRLLEKGD